MTGSSGIDVLGGAQHADAVARQQPEIGQHQVGPRRRGPAQGLGLVGAPRRRRGPAPRARARSIARSESLSSTMRMGQADAGGGSIAASPEARRPCAPPLRGRRSPSSGPRSRPSRDRARRGRFLRSVSICARCAGSSRAVKSAHKRVDLALQRVERTSGCARAPRGRRPSSGARPARRSAPAAFGSRRRACRPASAASPAPAAAVVASRQAAAGSGRPSRSLLVRTREGLLDLLAARLFLAGHVGQRLGAGGRRRRPRHASNGDASEAVDQAQVTISRYLVSAERVDKPSVGALRPASRHRACGRRSGAGEPGVDVRLGRRRGRRDSLQPGQMRAFTADGVGRVAAPRRGTCCTPARRRAAARPARRLAPSVSRQRRIVRRRAATARSSSGSASAWRPAFWSACARLKSVTWSSGKSWSAC